MKATEPAFGVRELRVRFSGVPSGRRWWPVAHDSSYRKGSILQAGSRATASFQSAINSSPGEPTGSKARRWQSLRSLRSRNGTTPGTRITTSCECRQRRSRSVPVRGYRHRQEATRNRSRGDDALVKQPVVKARDDDEQVESLRVEGDVDLADWREEGLLHPSLLRLAKVAVDADLIDRGLGKLSSTDMKSARSALRRVFVAWMQ